MRSEPRDMLADAAHVYHIAYYEDTALYYSKLFILLTDNSTF